MKQMLLGLGLLLAVSLLDIGQGFNVAWAYDLPAAQEALKKKEFEKVIELLSPEVDKLNRDGLFVLAKAYSSLKKHEAAVKAYTACLALNPKDFEAKTLIGAEQLVAGKDRDALVTLKEALEMNPKSVTTYKILGRYYEKRKNKYEQRLLYEDMISKVGERSDAINKLCELTTTDRLYDLASKHCQKGIQLTPQYADNYVYMGITYKDTGKPEKAIEYFKKAADEFPKSELAQMTYAQHLDEQKNFITSYNYYKRALAANPKSVPALVGFGQASLEIQKYAESLEAFDKACRLDRKSMAAFRKASSVLRNMKITDWHKKFEAELEVCDTKSVE